MPQGGVLLKLGTGNIHTKSRHVQNLLPPDRRPRQSAWLPFHVPVLRCYVSSMQNEAKNKRQRCTLRVAQVRSVVHACFCSADAFFLSLRARPWHHSYSIRIMRKCRSTNLIRCLAKHLGRLCSAPDAPPRSPWPQQQPGTVHKHLFLVFLAAMAQARLRIRLANCATLV